MSKMTESLYETMFLIRIFEEKLESLFKENLLFGTLHSCAGQEPIAVGVISNLTKEDLVLGNHRSHGHYLAYSGDVEGLMGEIMGKQAGVVGGRGGSQHLQNGGFYSNGVQGSMVPIATGMAMAEKIQKTENIVINFIGDGTLGQGVVYESMNMASLFSLPILYVCENNMYAMSTHVNEAVSGKIIDRPKAFGIDAYETSVQDVEELQKFSGEIMASVRKKNRPAFLVCNTYRKSGHSKSDNNEYRPKEEEEIWLKKDGLTLTGAKISDPMRIEIEQRCIRRVEDVFEKLKNSEFPEKKDLFFGLYSGKK